MIDEKIKKGILLGIGWAHADACCHLDKGVDPRKVVVPEQLERAMIDLAPEMEKTD